MKIYAVIDRKAKAIVSVFTSVNDESAERSFLMLLTGPKNIFTDFPEDFELYRVAELSYDNSLKVCAIGSEDLENAGCIVSSYVINSYRVDAPVKAGADYDKRYLAMVHADRFPVFDDSDRVEASDEIKKD